MRDVTQCDVVVVGGGIVGAMVAHRLSAARPKRNIIVVDRSLVANGATRFSAGLHLPYGQSTRTRRMAQQSERQYDAMARRNASLLVTPIRLFGITTKERAGAALEHLSNRARISRTPDVTSSSLPPMTRSGERVVVTADGCHYANAAGVTEHLVSLLRRRNVRIWEGVRVVSFNPERDVVHIELHDRRALRAGQVVLAPGPWICGSPFEHIAERFSIRIKKVISFHVDLAPRRFDPAIYFLDDEAFLLPVSERGHWLFSYRCRQWDVAPDNDALAIDVSDRQEAVAILEKYFPQLAGKCASGRVFCDAYSSDGEPIVAGLPSSRNVVLAGAPNGSGYRLAPAMAEEAMTLLYRNAGAPTQGE